MDSAAMHAAKQVRRVEQEVTMRVVGHGIRYFQFGWRVASQYEHDDMHNQWTAKHEKRVKYAMLAPHQDENVTETLRKACLEMTRFIKELI